MQGLVNLVQPKSICVFETTSEEESTAPSRPSEVKVHFLLDAENGGLVGEVEIHYGER